MYIASLFYRLRKIRQKLLCYFFSLLPIKRNKIVFRNFHGKGYGDNPKYIAQMIIDCGLDYDLVWLLSDLSISMQNQIRKVKYNSVRSIYELSTARVIVSNVKNLSPFIKRRSQYYIQTWHSGFTIKQIEKAAADKLSPTYIENSQKESLMIDLLLSNSALQTEEYKNNFWYEGEIMECGLPRNDIFFKDKGMLSFKIRKLLSIQEGQTFILYAPTFRDDGNMSIYQIDYSKLLESFNKVGFNDCVIGIRLHPNISSIVSTTITSNTIHNLSNYPDMNELLIAADILITDYSSSMFDFGMLQKPVFLYATDIEQYQTMRGLKPIFFKLPFPLAKNEMELYSLIESFDSKKYQERLHNFFESEYVCYDTGNASEVVVKRIRNIIESNNG